MSANRPDTRTDLTCALTPKPERKNRVLPIDTSRTRSTLFLVGEDEGRRQCDLKIPERIERRSTRLEDNLSNLGERPILLRIQID